eukprot:scaffold3741_cov234-Pinguiococcus_pyrenoidosus.AAC.1
MHCAKCWRALGLMPQPSPPDPRRSAYRSNRSTCHSRTEQRPGRLDTNAREWADCNACIPAWHRLKDLRA